MESELGELAKKDLDELYVMLGHSLRGLVINEDGSASRLEFSASPSSEDEARKHGQESFDALRRKVFLELCEKWKACEKLDRVKQSGDEIDIAVVISDVLAAALVGFPVAILTVILMKIGVKRFCKCS